MDIFIKGILVGIGNIAPGLSGSALLVSFGLYEKVLHSISYFLKDIKKNIRFLTTIGTGIILGTICFSKILLYFITFHETNTRYIFLGFIIGTIPNLIKTSNIKGFKKRHLITMIISFTLGMIIILLKPNTVTTFNYNFYNILFMGALLSFSSVIPGISSTVLLSTFGFYNTYLEAISNLNFIIIFPLAIGFITFTYILSYIMNFMFKKFYTHTQYFIIGFVLSTLPGIINVKLPFNYDSILTLILMILSIYISYIFTKKNN